MNLQCMEFRVLGNRTPRTLSTLLSYPPQRSPHISPTSSLDPSPSNQGAQPLAWGPAATVNILSPSYQYWLTSEPRRFDSYLHPLKCNSTSPSLFSGEKATKSHLCNPTQGVSIAIPHPGPRLEAGLCNSASRTRNLPQPRWLPAPFYSCCRTPDGPVSQSPPDSLPSAPSDLGRHPAWVQPQTHTHSGLPGGRRGLCPEPSLRPKFSPLA